MAETNLHGRCECECGQRTFLATRTDRSNGQIKGQPTRYLPGHDGRSHKSATRLSIIAAYAKGEPTDRIAAQYGISKQAVKTIFQRYATQAQRKERAQPLATRLSIVAAYADGVDLRVLAAQYGLSKNAILQAFQRHATPEQRAVRKQRGKFKTHCIRGHELSLQNRAGGRPNGGCLRCLAMHSNNRFLLLRGSTPADRLVETLAYMDRIRETPCFYCGDPGTCIDHQCPVTQGGLTVPENLVSACTSCNSSKGGRTIAEWIAAAPPGLPPPHHHATWVSVVDMIF